MLIVEQTWYFEHMYHSYGRHKKSFMVRVIYFMSLRSKIKVIYGMYHLQSKSFMIVHKYYVTWTNNKGDIWYVSPILECRSYIINGTYHISHMVHIDIHLINMLRTCYLFCCNLLNKYFCPLHLTAIISCTSFTR